MERDAVAQEVQQRRVDFDGTIGGLAIEVTDRARFAEDRELVLEPIDLVERRACGRHSRRLLARERNLEPASHRAPVDPDPVVLASLAPGRHGREKIAPASARRGDRGEPEHSGVGHRSAEYWLRNP
jgi:hypothetical protein